MNEIIIPIATAIIGALIGTYGGAYFIGRKQEKRMKKVRAIAIKALRVLKKYSKQSFIDTELLLYPLNFLKKNKTRY